MLVWCSGEGNGNPLQYSCIENSVDRGAWWAAAHGVAQSRTRLKQLSMHALAKEMATHSNILAWRIPGMVEPGGLLSVGSHRVGHDWSDLAAAAVWCFAKVDTAATHSWTSAAGRNLWMCNSPNRKGSSQSGRVPAPAPLQSRWAVISSSKVGRGGGSFLPRNPVKVPSLRFEPGLLGWINPETYEPRVKTRVSLWQIGQCSQHYSKEVNILIGEDCE